MPSYGSTRLCIELRENYNYKEGEEKAEVFSKKIEKKNLKQDRRFSFLVFIYFDKKFPLRRRS